MKKKILITIGLALLFYGALVVGRVIGLLRIDATRAAVAKIHATHITMDDVTGTHLPPDPGSEADKTLAGVDANHNGIRDDVELAIFKAYPHSARTRAVLLQYAQALQLEFTQPIVNGETVTAVAEETSRAYSCIGDVEPRNNVNRYNLLTDEYTNFLENSQLNTKDRKIAQKNFYNAKLKSFELKNGCDLDLSKLPSS